MFLPHAGGSSPRPSPPRPSKHKSFKTSFKYTLQTEADPIIKMFSFQNENLLSLILFPLEKMVLPSKPAGV